MKRIREVDLHFVWFKLEPFIERGLLETKRDKQYNLWWIKEEITDGNLQCMVSDEFEMVALTKMHTFPTGYKALEIWMVVGDNIDNWLEDFFLLVSKFAKQNGCKELFAGGRDGWQRKLKKLSGDTVTRESLIHMEI